jgi:glycosyltransferase involved in cell wall biosynthesis
MPVKIKIPKVSVILTSFNHAKYLREAIDSTLSQSYENFELIIWDDASRDESWEIIESYDDPRIKSFKNQKQMRGVYGLNKAISQIAAGEYIAIHHSDDIWEPNKLEEQVNFLSAHDNYGAVFSQVEFIDEEGGLFVNANYKYYDSFNQKNRSNNEWILYILQNGNPFCHPSALIKRECYDTCGLYRYGFAQTGDLDMWIRILIKFNAYIIPKKLVKFRIRDSDTNTSAVTKITQHRAFYEGTKILENLKEIETKEQIIEIFKLIPGEEYNELGKEAFLSMALEKTNMIFNKDILVLDLLFYHLNMSGDKIHTQDIQRLVELTGKLDPFNYQSKYWNENE